MYVCMWKWVSISSKCLEFKIYLCFKLINISSLMVKITWFSGIDDEEKVLINVAESVEIWTMPRILSRIWIKYTYMLTHVICILLVEPMGKYFNDHVRFSFAVLSSSFIVALTLAVSQTERGYHNICSMMKWPAYSIVWLGVIKGIFLSTIKMMHLIMFFNCIIR